MSNNNSIQWSVACRPHKMDDVYGLDKVKVFFKKAAKKEEYPNAVLIQGKYGCGKTTMAKIIAQTMVCTNLDDEQNPCGECKSCKAIVDETWSRDVINLDGAREESADLINTINSFTATAAFLDKRKIIIIDEVQAMSYQCRAKLLKLIENPKVNIHYIFTSMVEESTNSKDKEAAIKAFGSRCEVFKIPEFTDVDLMRYLYGMIKYLKLDVPDIFKTYGIKMIAENCDHSIRKATTILQQCVETETFEPEEIESYFGIASVEDFYTTLFRLLNGEKSDQLFDTLINVNDYDGMIRLSVLAFANAESYRLFGRINGFNGNGVTKAMIEKAKKSEKYDDEMIALFEKEDNRLTAGELATRTKLSKELAGEKSMSEWQRKNTINQIAPLVAHPNYIAVRDMFTEFYKDNAVYTSKSSYILGMCKILDYCSNNSPNSKLNNGEQPLRRRLAE